jgi:hypothetical protein
VIVIAYKIIIIRRRRRRRRRKKKKKKKEEEDAGSTKGRCLAIVGKMHKIRRNISLENGVMNTCMFYLCGIRLYKTRQSE